MQAVARLPYLKGRKPKVQTVTVNSIKMNSIIEIENFMELFREL